MKHFPEALRSANLFDSGCGYLVVSRFKADYYLADRKALLFPEEERMNEELVRLSAQLRQNLTRPQVRKAVAEIEQPWKRLTTEWTF